jgi:streptomycin 6-kinase
MFLNLPSLFRKSILSIYPKTGEKWLRHLPQYIEGLSQKWGLSQLNPLDNLSYHYVLEGLQNDKKIILKLGPSASIFNQEKEALLFFKKGGVSLLENSSSYNALLLERLTPGISLTSLYFEKEKEACLLFAQTVKTLQNQKLEARPSFTPIKNFLKDLKQEVGLPSNTLILEATSLFEDLLNSTDESVPLHGDLHGDNILQHGNRWVAIDPKGYRGDLLYELAAFIRNPYQKLMQRPDAKQIMETRIQFLSDFFKVDSTRLKKWVFVQCVLGGIWAHQDHLGKESSNWFLLAQQMKSLEKPLT